MRDRFGLGWRPPLAAAIIGNLDRIDVVEVIADDFFVSRPQRRALQTLARQVPVVLHGIQMGLASTVAVEQRRVSPMASLLQQVEARFWSEHLAFVRGGGLEIGHLAAPPRNPATVDGTVRNLRHVAAAVGAMPLIENIATLIDPPGSTMDEASWISAIVEGANADLLLDLHNLHANAVNFGFDAMQFLDAIPLHRVRAVHLAGGRRIAGERLLDDHLHDVPDPVYAMLQHVASRQPAGLTVILERDGCYPHIDVLLAELDRARAAVECGRRRLDRAA